MASQGFMIKYYQGGRVFARGIASKDHVAFWPAGGHLATTAEQSLHAKEALMTVQHMLCFIDSRQALLSNRALLVYDPATATMHEL